MNKPLLVSSGEPAGIGPDLCLSLVDAPYPIVILGDKEMLAARAQQLKLDIHFLDYSSDSIPPQGALTVLSIPCVAPVIAGTLNVENAAYVLQLLRTGAEQCLQGAFSALVTAPVHKGIINQSGFNFTGHTEFFAACCGVERTVMMLVCPRMRVALATTHLPLSQVAKELTAPLLKEVLMEVYHALQNDFSCISPKIYVAGLNPHAGEGGFLGREEIEIITPVIEALQAQGMDVQGPFSADTMFIAHQAKEPCDAFLAMYHDQGLPVLKYAGFGQAVNVTLGLPIIRTSVDHGTALDLAGLGHADASSLHAACEVAAHMAKIERREPCHL